MMNVSKYLLKVAVNSGLDPVGLQFPDCEIDPKSIKVIMISEVPSQNPDDWFYSSAAEPDYMRSTIGLFESAGVLVKNINDILDMGIYITTAVKSPKTEYAVDGAVVKAHLPILEAELDLFPELKVIMLMGDVAKKAVNTIARARTKKSVIPSQSTYRIRHNEYFWNGIRVFPSYIMTGGNIMIEKSKRDMIGDDIRRMMEILQQFQE